MSEKVLKLQSKNMGQKTVESESAEKDSNEILELSPELEETLDEMQLDDAQKFKLIQAISTTEQYSGPIPHPKIISGYEEILPGAADRILSMAEKESQHRHDMDDKFHKTDSRDSLLSIVSAFILTAILAVGGIVIILKIPETWGTVTGFLMTGGSVATVLTTFIKGTKVTWKLNNSNKQ